MAVLLVTHESSFAHVTGAHPERVDRLRVIMEAIECRDAEEYRHCAARAAAREDILRCHTHEHYELIASTAGHRGCLDPDTIFCPDTFTAALHAAGAGLSALDAIAETGERTAFLPIRPPGHHAMAGRPMGFCFFNNIAIAARYAQAVRGYSRVAIVDWDVHHGNGTQEIFYDDPSVFYYSLHLSPHYPGTGHEDETGAGEARGTTVNRPLPHGYPARHYVDLFRSDVADIARDFRPDLILLSAGFDSHREDPLGGLDLTEETFRELGTILRGHAGERPIVSFLEGGYNLARLGPSVVAHLEGIAG